jgi:tRNA uridine 5-carboxymethylaminomethyl modification enzyme
VGEERRAWFEERQAERARWSTTLGREAAASELADTGIAVRRDAGRKPLAEWLRFPEVDLADLGPWLDPELDGGSEIALEMAEDATYAPYLARQEGELRDLRASEAVGLGADFPFAEVPGLSNEMIERLSAARPANLAAAGRVRGITPAALAAVLVFARRTANAA